MNTPMHVLATAGVAVLAMAGGANAAGQTMKTITATSGRPLWHALDELEVAVGGTVNYEDVPYENAADCGDVSTPEWRVKAPAGYQLLVPRLGTVTADIPVPASGAATQNDLIYDVNLLLASYRQKDLPGDFQVEEANGMLYVMATTVLGANGAVHAVTSPMLTAITIPAADRSVVETVRAIFDAVGRAAGLRFGLGHASVLALAARNVWRHRSRLQRLRLALRARTNVQPSPKAQATRLFVRVARPGRSVVQ
jgi:hypothetical protein